MDSPRPHTGQRNENNRGQTDHGGSSSSSHRTRNPEVSSASMNTKTPKNAQVGRSTKEQTVKTDGGKKAASCSRRFSRRRKQDKDDKSIGSSSVAVRSQTETLNDPVSKNVQNDAIEERGAQGTPVADRSQTETPNRVSNNVQDVTTEDRGAQGTSVADRSQAEKLEHYVSNNVQEKGAQDTTPKTPKRRRPQTGRKEKKSDGNRNESPVLQSSLQHDATEGDIVCQDESQKQKQRHLQNKTDGNKSVAAPGSVKRMSKQELQEDVTAREESIKGEEQKHHHNTNKPSLTIAKQNEEKDLSQTRVQGGATRVSNGQPDEAQKKMRSRRRNKNAAVTSNNSNVSQNGLQDSAISSKNAPISKQEDVDSRNTMQGSVGREVTNSQHSIQKEEHPGPKLKSQANTAVSVEGKEGKMAQRGLQLDTTRVDSRKKDEVLKQGRTRRSATKSAMGEESRCGNEVRHQGQKNPQNLDKRKQRVATKSKERKTSQSGPPRGAEGGLQERKNRKHSQKERQNKSKTNQTVHATSEESKLFQNTTSLRNDSSNDTAGEETAKQEDIPSQKDIVNERQSVVLDANNNVSENEVRGGETEVESVHVENRSEIEAGEVPSSSKQKVKQTSNKLESQRKSPTIKAMRDFIDKSPEDIVNWLISDHSSLFKKQHKMKDEVVALLVRLLGKACDCESCGDLTQLFSVLSTSWFLSRRVTPVLDQLVANKSKGSQTKHFSLETVKDIAKVQTEILKRFPTNKCPLLAKLHGLVNSGKLQDQGVISAVQEQMKLLKKEKVARSKQEAEQKRQRVRAGNVFIFFL